MGKIRNDKIKQGKPKITVIGAANIDLVIKTAYFPVPGETVFGKDFLMVPGGKGANQAVAAAKLGAKVCFISRIGKDVFGDKVIDSLRGESVKIDYIVRDARRPTGTALIFVDKNGENVIVVSPGANAALKKGDIDRGRSTILSSDILVLQLEVPPAVTEYAVNLAYNHQIPVILNPAPACGMLSPRLLRKIDIITPNETELQKLTGKKTDCLESICQAAQYLLNQGVGIIIVTMGRKGFLLVTEKKTEVIPARKIEAVDTTAAGDIFTGSLAFGLVSGMEIAEAAAFANCAAALSATKMGAQSSMPTMAEVLKFSRN